MAMRLIVNSLLGAGWLVTLSKPTMIEDLAKEYGYTNMSLLKNVLTLLETQNIVERVGDEYSIKEIVTSPIRPSDIGTVLANFYYDCAQFIPDALRGKAVPIQDVPRVVLETVFGSTLTEIGRGVLLRSFSGKETKDVAIAAFADVGIPFILQQINDILKPERIRLFLNDYRMVSPLTSMMGLLSDGDVRRKISTHLLGIETDWDVDLFYGEEFFAYNQNEIDAKDAQILIDHGVIAVSEGANMPSTLEATNLFLNAGVAFGPGKAAYCGMRDQGHSFPTSPDYQRG